jgi:hypothetical protein
VALVIWLATDPPTAPLFTSGDRAAKTASQQAAPARGPEGATAGQDTPLESGDEVAQLRAALRVARAERDEARRELMERGGRREPSHPASVASGPAPELPSASTPAPTGLGAQTQAPVLADMAPPRLAPVTPRQMPLPAATINSGPLLKAPKVPGSDSHQFAGFWFFAKTVDPNRSRNLYYPEFIEATLTEQSGSIHGRYRSRYQIVDRAISPDVNFEFNGSPNNGTIACSWSGPGGARGQLTLRLTGENAMKVEWTASEMGSIQGLASGTATLTRRIE